MWRDLNEEDGVALVFALLAALIIGGLAAVMFARAMSETNATSRERDFEAAIHVAEAAVDDVILGLNDDDDFATSTPGNVCDPENAGTRSANCHIYDEALNASQAVQRAWALEQVNTSACDLVDVGSGQACGMRPILSDGTLLPWIFGIGLVPEAADARTVRVVKIQFDKGFFSPTKAVLTNGDLKFGGKICGDAADVHSNSDVTLTGGADTTDPGDTCPDGSDPDGNVTATGNYTPTGSNNVGSDSGSVDRKETVPELNAISVYRNHAADEVSYDGAGNYTGTWFDLCVDHTIREPAFVTVSGEQEPDPCQGDVLYDGNAAGAPAQYRGWSFSASSNSWDVGGTVQEGVYYVYEADVSISGNIDGTALLTVVADAVGDINPGERPDGGTGCLLDGSEDGNVRITGVGGGAMEPFLGDLLLHADRDVQTSGNVSTSLSGAITAHEQVDLGGTVSIAGAVIAEDACDSPGSPVSENNVRGNFQVAHSGDRNLPFDSVTRITAWNEI